MRGILFAFFLTRMKYYCQHCHRYRCGDGYRVTSEQSESARLNLVVCYECYLDARRVGLSTDRIVGADLAHGQMRYVQATGIDAAA